MTLYSNGMDSINNRMSNIFNKGVTLTDHFDQVIMVLNATHNNTAQANHKKHVPILYRPVVLHILELD